MARGRRQSAPRCAGERTPAQSVERAITIARRSSVALVSLTTLTFSFSKSAALARRQKSCNFNDLRHDLRIVCNRHPRLAVSTQPPKSTILACISQFLSRRAVIECVRGVVREIKSHIPWPRTLSHLPATSTHCLRRNHTCYHSPCRHSCRFHMH